MNKNKIASIGGILIVVACGLFLYFFKGVKLDFLSRDVNIFINAYFIFPPVAILLCLAFLFYANQYLPKVSKDSRSFFKFLLIGIFLAMAAIGILLRLVFDNLIDLTPEGSSRFQVDKIERNSETIFILLVGMFVSSLSEELLKRVVLLKSLIGLGLNSVLSVVISSIVFAGFHFNYFMKVPLWPTAAAMFTTIFVIGLILGYIYLKTGSLILVAVIHFFINQRSELLRFTHWLRDRSEVLAEAFLNGFGLIFIVGGA